MEDLDAEEAIQRGTDDWSTEASRSRSACSGSNSQGRDQRIDILSLEAKYAGLEVDQVRRMAQLQE